MFDLYGYFVAPERRGPPVTLFRGCFVLDLLSVNIIIIFVCGYKQNRDLPIVLYISPQTFQRCFAHFLLFSFGIPPKILLAYPFGKNYQNQIYSNKAAICPCCKCLFKKHFFRTSASPPGLGWSTAGAPPEISATLPHAVTENT